MLVCFGEVLLRMTAPRRGLLRNAQSFDADVGGAEANVAVALASLGHHTRMVSRIPSNGLGQRALKALRAAGVDCSGVELGSGRMGLYFVSAGAGSRASEIVYDRTDSVFARAEATSYDWRALLTGATHLHLSGITPALGPNAAAAALAAATAARALGVTVILDGNFRARLWETSGADPRQTLLPLIQRADIFFGNHRDVSLLLDRPVEGEGTERRREAALAAFDAFPNLQLVASTARRIEDADRHWLAARVDTRAGAAQTPEAPVFGIIDRIGGGDAFAAGVLHQLIRTPRSLDAIAQAGLALAALKHTLPGDTCELTQGDIDAWVAGELDVRR